VNVDPTEADLSHLDPQDLIAAVTSASAQREVGGDINTPTPETQEQRQKLWWYLLLGVLLLMAVETALSNRLSKATT
jgi:hypothetical protein